MKIGIFDSGLGGLFVTRALTKKLPQYDYVYLGDTQRMPYGNRSRETIYQFLREAVEYLFSRDCELIIVACNTASAEALRRIQQEYFPKHYPKRRVLGVIIPTAEIALENGMAKRIGVLATQGTVHSRAYVRELKKIAPHIEIFQQAAPLLVPIIESNSIKFADPILYSYLKPLLEKNIDTLILGCTHYPLLKPLLHDILGNGVKLIDSAEAMADIAADLINTQNIGNQSSSPPDYIFYVSDLPYRFQTIGERFLGRTLGRVELVSL